MSRLLSADSPQHRLRRKGPLPRVPGVRLAARPGPLQQASRGQVELQEARTLLSLATG